MRKGDSVATTKLNIPKTNSAIVSRLRLLKKIDQGLKGKLTLICAPAGSGKTTLVGEWAAQSNAPVAWLSLDEFDDDFFRFWKAVLAAIEPYTSGFFDEIYSMLNNSQPANFHPFIAHLLNQLNDRKQRLVVVLDDYHVLNNESIHASVAFFIKRMPAHLRFLIISRSEPSFSLARFASSSDLFRIDATDLNFTVSEGKQYFQLMNMNLSSVQVEQLHKQTEGWVTGMKLVALSLQEGREYSHLIESLTGSHRYFSDYLFHEVFRLQQEEVQVFLLRTSILNRFQAPLCEAVSGQTNSQQRLEQLEHSNLFLIPLDETRDWYRYHHLFADFLEKRLRKENPRLWKELYFLAGKWFEDHHDIYEAIEYYLTGKHERQAVRLIENILPELIGGRWDTLYRWLSVLPQSLLEEKPDLYFTQVFCLIADGDWELIQSKWNEAETYFNVRKGSWPEEDIKKFTGYLHLIQSFIAVCQLGDLDKALTHSKEYFRCIPDTAMMHHIDIDTGDISIVKAFGGLMGKLRKAMIDIWGHSGTSFAGIFYIGFAEVMYEWNRLKEAESNAWTGYEIGKKLNSGKVIAPASVLLSKIYAIKYSAKQAVHFLEKIKTDLRDNHLYFWADLIDTQILRLQCEKMDFDALSSWLENWYWILDEDMPPNHFFQAFMLIRVLISLKEWDKAEYWLAHLRRMTERLDRLGERIEVLILQAILYKRKKQIGQAVKFISDAFMLGEKERYIRTFIDEEKEVFELVQICIENRKNDPIQNGQKPSNAYLYQLYEAYKNELLIKNGRSMHSSRIEQLTNKEQDVLHLLTEGLPNRQIAERLNITVGTVKSHLHNIYEKLQVKNRWEAMEYVKQKWRQK